MGDVAQINLRPIRSGSAWTVTCQRTQNPQQIQSSTNAAPIVLTLPQHGYTNGQLIRVYGHSNKGANNNWNGNPASWTLASVTQTTFALQSSTGTAVGLNTGYAAATIDGAGCQITSLVAADESSLAPIVTPGFAWITQGITKFSLSLSVAQIATLISGIQSGALQSTSALYYHLYFTDSLNNGPFEFQNGIIPLIF